MGMRVEMREDEGDAARSLMYQGRDRVSLIFPHPLSHAYRGKGIHLPHPPTLPRYAPPFVATATYNSRARGLQLLRAHMSELNCARFAIDMCPAQFNIDLRALQMSHARTSDLDCALVT